MRAQEIEKFLEELKEYENKGVSIWLEGQKSNPYKVVETCVVREESHYMRDYVSNDAGKLIELHFDKVNE